MSHPSIGSAQVNQPPPVVDEYILPVKRESLYLEREPLVDHNVHRSGVSLYGRDPALSSLRPSGMHGAGPLLTQVRIFFYIFISFHKMFGGLSKICGLFFFWKKIGSVTPKDARLKNLPSNRLGTL